MSAVARVAVPAATRTIDSTKLAALRDYVSLTKPRIAVLLLLTELTSMIVAGGAWPTLRGVVAAIAGGFCASGGASALTAGSTAISTS